jgi:hypothetical protein
MGSIILAATLGVVFAYFFDPERGRNRRSLVRDRIAAASGQVGSQVSSQVSRLRPRQGSTNDGSVGQTGTTDGREEPSEDITRASA